MNPVSHGGSSLIPNRKPGHHNSQSLKSSSASPSVGPVQHLARPTLENTILHQSSMRPSQAQHKPNFTNEQRPSEPQQHSPSLGQASVNNSIRSPSSQSKINQTENIVNTTTTEENSNQDRIHFPLPDKNIKPSSNAEVKNSPPLQPISTNDIMNPNQVPPRKQSLLPHLILPNMMSSNVQHPSSVNGEPQLRPTWPEPKPQKIAQSIGTAPMRLPAAAASWIDGSINGNGMPFDIQRIPTSSNKFPERPMVPLAMSNGSKFDLSQNHKTNVNSSQNQPAIDEMLSLGSGKVPSLVVQQASPPFTTAKPAMSLPSKVPTSSEKPIVEESDGGSAPWDKLRVSGCNIYGTFYKVDEFIKELSSSCKRCTCSTYGVQCTKTC